MDTKNQGLGTIPSVQPFYGALQSYIVVPTKAPATPAPWLPASAAINNRKYDGVKMQDASVVLVHVPWSLCLLSGWKILCASNHLLAIAESGMRCGSMLSIDRCKRKCDEMNFCVSCFVLLFLVKDGDNGFLFEALFRFSCRRQKERILHSSGGAQNLVAAGKIVQSEYLDDVTMTTLRKLQRQILILTTTTVQPMFKCFTERR